MGKIRFETSWIKDEGVWLHTLGYFRDGKKPLWGAMAGPERGRDEEVLVELLGRLKRLLEKEIHVKDSA